MTTFTMTLDGHPVAGEKTFGVINPATGSGIGYEQGPRGLAAFTQYQVINVLKS